MDETEKKGFKRRTVLKAAASLLATEVMPAEKTLPALDAVTAAWRHELIKGGALVDFLNSHDMLETFATLHGFNTVNDVKKDTLKVGGISIDELSFNGGHLSVSSSSIADRLGRAWQGNLESAAQQLKVCEKLEQAIAAGIDTSPKAFFTLLEYKGSQEKIAHMMFEREMGYPFNPTGTTELTVEEMTFSLKEHIASRLSRLSERYPALLQSDSMQELATSMRGEIAQALKLPLEKGCLDRAIAQGGREHIRALLERAPELIPQGSLSTFKQIVAENQPSVRTAQPQELSSSQERLNWRMENVPFRLGLTPLQETSSWIEDNRNNLSFTARLKDSSAQRDKKDDGRKV